MSADLETKRYVRTPFVVEATIITEENIDSIAEKIGEVKVRNGEKYIALDRRIIPNLSRAYVGWFFTTLDDNYRCYSPKVFNAQFVSIGDDTEVTFSLEETTEEG
jgi:hypothetical protein